MSQPVVSRGRTPLFELSMSSVNKKVKEAHSPRHTGRIQIHKATRANQLAVTFWINRIAQVKPTSILPISGGIVLQFANPQIEEDVINKIRKGRTKGFSLNGTWCPVFIDAPDLPPDTPTPTQSPLPQQQATTKPLLPLVMEEPNELFSADVAVLPSPYGKTNNMTRRRSTRTSANAFKSPRRPSSTTDTPQQKPAGRRKKSVGEQLKDKRKLKEDIKEAEQQVQAQLDKVAKVLSGDEEMQTSTTTTTTTGTTSSGGESVEIEFAKEGGTCGHNLPDIGILSGGAEKTEVVTLDSSVHVKFSNTTPNTSCCTSSNSSVTQGQGVTVPLSLPSVVMPSKPSNSFTLTQQNLALIGAGRAAQSESSVSSASELKSLPGQSPRVHPMDPTTAQPTLLQRPPRSRSAPTAKDRHEILLNGGNVGQRTMMGSPAHSASSMGGGCMSCASPAPSACGSGTSSILKDQLEQLSMRLGVTSQLASTLEAQQSEVKRVTAQVALLKRQVQEKDERLEQLTKMATETEQHIERLVTEKVESADQLSIQSHALENSIRTIEQLDEVLLEKNKRIEEMENEMTELLERTRGKSTTPTNETQGKVFDLLAHVLERAEGLEKQVSEHFCKMQIMEGIIHNGEHQTEKLEQELQQAYGEVKKWKKQARQREMDILEMKHKYNIGMQHMYYQNRVLINENMNMMQMSPPRNPQTTNTNLIHNQVQYLHYYNQNLPYSVVPVEHHQASHFPPPSPTSQTSCLTSSPLRSPHSLIVSPQSSSPNNYEVIQFSPPYPYQQATGGRKMLRLSGSPLQHQDSPSSTKSSRSSFYSGVRRSPKSDSSTQLQPYGHSTEKISIASLEGATSGGGRSPSSLPSPAAVTRKRFSTETRSSLGSLVSEVGEHPPVWNEYQSNEGTLSNSSSQYRLAEKYSIQTTSYQAQHVATDVLPIYSVPYYQSHPQMGHHIPLPQHQHQQQQPIQNIPQDQLQEFSFYPPFVGGLPSTRQRCVVNEDPPSSGAHCVLQLGHEGPTSQSTLNTSCSSSSSTEQEQSMTDEDAFSPQTGNVRRALLPALNNITPTEEELIAIGSKGGSIVDCQALGIPGPAHSMIRLIDNTIQTQVKLEKEAQKVVDLEKQVGDMKEQVIEWKKREANLRSQLYQWANQSQKEAELAQNQTNRTGDAHCEVTTQAADAEDQQRSESSPAPQKNQTIDNRNIINNTPTDMIYRGSLPTALVLQQQQQQHQEKVEENKNNELRIVENKAGETPDLGNDEEGSEDMEGEYMILGPAEHDAMQDEHESGCAHDIEFQSDIVDCDDMFDTTSNNSRDNNIFHNGESSESGSSEGPPRLRSIHDEVLQSPSVESYSSLLEEPGLTVEVLNQHTH